MANAQYVKFQNFAVVYYIKMIFFMGTDILVLGFYTVCRVN
jgi:hypothetical protein